MNIKIYPLFNAHYYSFYMAGLSMAFGKKAIEFSTDGFPEGLHHHCLAFTIGDIERNHKIYISAGDGSGVSEEGLTWCDVYAKVNIDPDVMLAKFKHKILPIGPSFGVRYLSLPETLISAVKSFWMVRTAVKKYKEHFAYYYRQWKYRLPLEFYQPGVAEDDYIFFAGSLWKKESHVNQLRANFIEACRSIPQIFFEGGFAPRYRNDISGFEHLTLNRSYTFDSYLNKAKKSFVVFNTPAVQNCLGWKLGEFLALGKAIISTPLTRAMPAPLIHGRHIHYVDGSKQSIREAILYIHQNSGYRQKLEQGAREYWLEYLQPQSVIDRILKAVLP